MIYVSSSDAQKWVIEAYKSTQDGDNSPLIELLKQQDAERHPLPDVEDMCYSKINRYWFWKLDYLLWKKIRVEEGSGFQLADDEEAAANAYKFTKNRSIEHLHPQTGGDVEVWKDIKHAFGNLAMISLSFNSTQSNDSVGVKFSRLRDTQIVQKTLQSIKLLLMFKCAGGEEAGWTPQNAKDHGAAMLELLQDDYALQKRSAADGSM